MKFMKMFALTCFALSVFAVSAYADTGFAEMLRAHQGKKIEVATEGGHVYKGVVKNINNEVVYIGELSGREFYEAVVNVGAIEAIVVRTPKEKSDE